MKEDHPEQHDADPIRIVIADDQTIVRRGLCMLLDLEPGLAIVGEAANGTQALDLALQLRPDVLLAEVTLPPPDGIALATQLLTVLPETRTVIVSMYEDTPTVRAAFAAGAFGYVIKRASESQLVRRDPRRGRRSPLHGPNAGRDAVAAARTPVQCRMRPPEHVLESALYVSRQVCGRENERDRL